jgi:hypothetical protein
MPDLALSRGVRRRDRGSLRPSVLFNMFLERDEEAPDGFARQSRQGLGEYDTIGLGPINGLFAKKGVFDEALFTISGGTLYNGLAALGVMAGAGPASFAAGTTVSSSELLVTRGSTAYSFNGATLASISFPDGNVRAVAYLGGYFIGVREGTNRFYWSTSQDGRTWDALDFAAAESAPDELLDAYVVNDGLWLMGSETVEFWQLTGSDPPFARVEGFLLKKGITATGCAAEADNTLFWWGHDNRIYRAAQGAPQGVSDNATEERLESSVLRDMFSYTYEGAVFVVVRTDTGTFVLNVGTGSWSEYGTYGRDTWRISAAAMIGDSPVFGDDTDPTLWQFEDGNWDDGDHLERRVSAGFRLPGGTITVHRIGLDGNPGDTDLLTGQGSEPVIEMRSSRDNGKRWGDWRSALLGAQGKYRQRIEKRRWGLFDVTGGLFEFRVTDPVPFRVSRVFANEPSGGRSSGGSEE